MLEGDRERKRNPGRTFAQARLGRRALVRSADRGEMCSRRGHPRARDRMKNIGRVVVALISLPLATTARADWWTNTDDHPRLIAPGVWYFSINVPVHPVGQLQFVNAQYDFYDFSTGVAASTNGISVDYAYDGPGTDWTDGRTFLAIAPTLFN